MRDENTPVNSPLPEEEVPSPAPAESQPQPDDAQPPQRPAYTKKQRLLALLGAIAMIALTLMYAYSIATGDLFFR